MRQLSSSLAVRSKVRTATPTRRKSCPRYNLPAAGVRELEKFGSVVRYSPGHIGGFHVARSSARATATRHIQYLRKCPRRLACDTRQLHRCSDFMEICSHELTASVSTSRVFARWVRTGYKIVSRRTKAGATGEMADSVLKALICIVATCDDFPCIGSAIRTRHVAVTSHIAGTLVLLTPAVSHFVF